MRRKIKGLSAEGRAGAMILNVTPFGVFMLVNVDFTEFLRRGLGQAVCAATFSAVRCSGCSSAT